MKYGAIHADMRIKALFLILVILSGCSLRSQPEPHISIDDLPTYGYYGYYGQYKVDPYIKVAMELQALGKGKAIRKLLDWGHKGVYNNQVDVLCRMLFVPRENSSCHKPELGVPSFLGGTSEANWPLEPCEIVDGIPFIIVNGYAGVGQRLPASDYVRYCYQLCDWNPYQYHPKTKQQKQDALNKLLASPKWKSSPPKEFFANQIE